MPAPASFFLRYAHQRPKRKLPTFDTAQLKICHWIPKLGASWHDDAQPVAWKSFWASSHHLEDRFEFHRLRSVFLFGRKQDRKLPLKNTDAEVVPEASGNGNTNIQQHKAQQPMMITNRPSLDETLSAGLLSCAPVPLDFPLFSLGNSLGMKYSSPKMMRSSCFPFLPCPLPVVCFDVANARGSHSSSRSDSTTWPILFGEAERRCQL
ncbi:hypothetical protein B0T20DRAFT_409900 [Sordaria brevicollis]|uniref:Uncharacterized protein n=1 Tax=Sordaria brevicollis TaxID=83679 RepID=A0AAE0UDE2_SORBR|nr:hypothetical protein B0T20DRAFT_409900 [Sordaria brevicollis]